MILICANKDDYNIKQVCEWLLYLGHKFILLFKGEDHIKIIKISIHEGTFVIQINNSKVSTSISAIKRPHKKYFSKSLYSTTYRC